MISYKLEICSNKEDLSLRACDVISESIKSAITKNYLANIALSGGSTPIEAYKLLAKRSLDWNRVNIFLGDERWVDSNSSLSNSLMLKKNMYVDTPSIKSTFYPVPTTELATPELSAIAYSKILQKHFCSEIPVFDLILLGLGDDGHTASLFPGTRSLTVNDHLITVSDGQGKKRITFTPLIINKAKKVIFLVSGKEKQQALKRLLDPNEAWERTPAKLIQPESEIFVLADKSAAENL